MAAWRRAIEFGARRRGYGEVEIDRAIANGACSRVERAWILLAYREDPSFFAVSRALGLIIRPVNVASSAPWSKARWLLSTIARALAENLRSPSKPRRGWCRWRAETMV
jgi:hypothetical protein